MFYLVKYIRNASFRVYLIQKSRCFVGRANLSITSKVGCGGCNPLVGIDCYALKYTEIILFTRYSFVFP